MLAVGSFILSRRRNIRLFCRSNAPAGVSPDPPHALYLSGDEGCNRFAPGLSTVFVFFGFPVRVMIDTPSNRKAAGSGADHSQWTPTSDIARQIFCWYVMSCILFFYFLLGMINRPKFETDCWRDSPNKLNDCPSKCYGCPSKRYCCPSNNPFLISFYHSM